MSDVVIHACRDAGCGTRIVFVLTPKGHQMPVDAATVLCTFCSHAHLGSGCASCSCGAFKLAAMFDSEIMTSHFQTCRSPARFRKKERKEAFNAPNRR